MKIATQLLYAFGIGVLFALCHIMMVHFKLSETLNVTFSLTAMVLAELLAFAVLKGRLKNRPIPFTTIFTLLCFTMVMSILLLALNSAYNPYVELKPLNYTDILVSLMIFGIGLPLIVSLVIWFTVAKNRNARLIQPQ